MSVATQKDTRRTETQAASACAVRMRALLLSFCLLLVAAPGAFAAQERMPLDGIGADACDWNGCTVANLDEDPDGAGTDWATATDNNTSHIGHFTFSTPTQALTAGAGLQEFRASVRKDAGCGTGTPTARIELWEAGGLVLAGPEVDVTAANSCTQGTDCQVISYTWDAVDVASAADVEIKVFGTKFSGSPGSRCSVDLGAVEWNAEVSGAVTPATLSNPTSPFANISSVSAFLGATIDNDNGSAVTDYGTVWGTVAAPTGNALSAGTNPGAIPPALPFSHTRADLSAQPPGMQVFFRGYADNGGGRAYSPDGTFYLEPNQATGVTFSNITSTAMRISWSDPGTGISDGSIVVVKQGSAVDSNVVDGNASYTANSAFGSGTQLGTGNYVVFRASGNLVDVSGLSASLTYYVAVYQYAGTADPTINYQQDAPATGIQATTGGGSAPTLSAPTSPFPTIDTGNATLGARIDTDGGGTITEYGTAWGTAPAPTANTAIAGTDDPALPHTFSHGRAIAQTPGTLIYFRGYADNGTRGYSPDGTFYLEPNEATGVTFSNITSTNIRVDWILPGTGAGDGSIVVVKQDSAVNSGPVDGTAHAANTAFGTGAQLGTGNYVVFRASGTQVTVSGLSASTTYHVAVYQYAGTAAPSINYQQDTPATGNQATTAPGSTPTLSTPTVSGIATISATLGATINSPGGSTVTSYGTVWGTSPAPTGNELPAGGTPPGFPHVFTHGRTDLPQASLVYFRGYADNGSGRGYSAEDSFRTEIATQAKTVRFRPTRSAETELDFTWSRGGGDGVIVLMRERTAVDADPVDGTEYAPNAVFGNGAQIGTGNYVMYVGPGTALTVTGLFPDLTYHVAIYEYAGSGSGPDGIQYLQAAPERGNSGHNGLHAANCVECHFGTGNAHGNFQVPRDADQQNACETCHNDTGPASAKIDFAIHTGSKYGVSVDCGSCHEVHNNSDFTTTDTHSGGTTDANIEWFRPDTTKYFPGALEPALLQANTGFFGWDDANSPWNGACQTCHQNTDWHRNDASLGPASHVHNSAADCRTCHSHLDGFQGVGGSCTDCHNQEREIGTSGTFRRQIVDNTGNATTGEFGTAFTSHHVNDGTGAEIVSKWDCVVCHAEGNAITGEPDGTYHQKDGVQLKDVDSGVAYADWSGLTSFERSSFCLSCHDADGATLITGRTDPDPDATTDPLNPFNDGITNSHEPAGFDGSPAPHSRGAVMDIEAKFDTLNASHHAVLGPAYVYQSDCVGAGDPHPCCTGAGTGPSCGLPFGSQVNNAIQGVRTDLDWNSVIDCEDCHYGSGTTMLSAHGTQNSRYMLRDSTGADVQPADESTLLCLRCHDPSDSTSLYPEHDKGNHIDNSRNLFDIACLSCHGGGEFGGIHGLNGQITDDNGGGSYNPNVFTYGSGLDLISNWTDFTDGGVSCSSNQTAALLDNCGQHPGQSYGRLPTRDDAAQRIYPQP